MKLGQFEVSGFYTGNSFELLKLLPDNSIHTVITSPPYYSLRRYVGAQPIVWGGDPNCNHEFVSDFCPNCDAWKGVLGNEPGWKLYVKHLVSICAQIRRVLRPDGIFWMNIGDTWSKQQSLEEIRDKNVLGIPWRVAFAMQEDGWWLRSECIWVKPNAMPESVKDRPTDSHEQVFMFTKSNRYFYDWHAVMEDAESEYRKPKPGIPEGWKQSFLTTPPTNFKGCGSNEFVGKRNRRDVWEINTKSYKGAHYAVFPKELVEPLILCSTSDRVCGICGAPRKKIIEKTDFGKGDSNTKYKDDEQSNMLRLSSTKQAYREHGFENPPAPRVVGFESTCEHNDDTGRAIVLDPFFGSGTIGEAAQENGRFWLGFDVNPAYLTQQRERTSQLSISMLTL